MADFAERVTVETKDDYNLYCHYVAGLVGIGLSQLFAASGLEDESVGEDEALANSMGLFLQKTNIIRDYLEDLEDGRTWYPAEVWRRHGQTLEEFREPKNREAALALLNEMVTDALGHIPDVFLYMSRLTEQTVFNFCAIPQVMAIATLQRCYNNYGVFTGVVKIRKGTAVSLMMAATSMNSLYSIFDRYLVDLEGAIPAGDPSARATAGRISVARGLLAEAREMGQYTAPPIAARPANSKLRLLIVGAVAAAAWYLAK